MPEHYHLTLLAQALAALGRYGQGLAALHGASALVEETGERYVEAEIHRLEGHRCWPRTARPGLNLAV